MDYHLRVLFLEDSPPDRELVCRTLQGEGLRCQWEHAKTKDEFLAALAGKKFDLILSDYSIPGYSGMDALAAARETQPDAPFLFVSGTIGEERAVESLKSGATDYVLKDRLGRLGPAVRRALNEKAERRLRAAAEEALCRTQGRLEQVLAQCPAMIYTLRVESEKVRLTWVSENIVLLFGYTPVEARQPAWWISCLHPQDRDAVQTELALLLAENRLVREFRVRNKNGAYRWVRDEQRLFREAGGNALGIIGSWTDITERKDLEEQFRQAQKMEAIGLLAGGIAHDFNNLLTVIRGNTELFLLKAGRLPVESTESLKQVLAASVRAAGLTQQLLAFGRKQSLQPQPLNLNHLARDSARMLERLVGAHIRFQCQFVTPAPFVQADAGMMEQVLMNLVINSRDAMPHRGELIISTERVVLDMAQSRRQPQARAGEFIRISIRDTGTGIRAEHLPRIFEPFFTTKEPGKGTGLGLATVYGIIQQHKGWIEVASEVNKGTIFHIYLPAISAPETEGAGIAAELEIPGGDEAILLVEDCEPVRQLAACVLKDLGYRIYEAASGTAALELWQNSAADVDLLLTDIVLPDGVTGRELAQKLSQSKVDLKVIFSSGYGREDLENETNGSRRNGTHYLEKPYSSRSLARMVRRCLDWS